MEMACNNFMLEMREFGVKRNIFRRTSPQLLYRDIHYFLLKANRIEYFECFCIYLNEKWDLVSFRSGKWIRHIL